MEIKRIFVQVSLAATGISVFFGCVPARKFEEMKAKQEKCDAEYRSLKEENEKILSVNGELQSTVQDLTKRLKALDADTNVQGKSLRQMTTNYDKLNDTYELLLKKYQQLYEGNSSETKKMMNELQAVQDNLQRREDELKESLSEMHILQGELQKREARVHELEEMIRGNESVMNQLKNKISSALLGFQGKGLTVEEKNGKVYVSLDAKLLFKSGSAEVDAEGKKAIRELANILRSQPEIAIVVEGHTDTDQVLGGKLKDNWDLSVMRATEVVRVLTNNTHVDPKRITAAGRSEYLPVDISDKAKNRRIEVILSPDLDELYNMLKKGN